MDRAMLRANVVTGARASDLSILATITQSEPGRCRAVHRPSVLRGPDGRYGRHPGPTGQRLVDGDGVDRLQQDAVAGFDLAFGNSSGEVPLATIVLLELLRILQQLP